MKDALAISIIIIPAILLIGLPVFGIAYFKASQEAKVFNRFSEKGEATTWDALFANLRVEACN